MEARHLNRLLLAVGLLLLAMGQLATAYQGCPFEQLKCRDYCHDKGCGHWYCGNVAFLECICMNCVPPGWLESGVIDYEEDQNRTVAVSASNHTESEGLEIPDLSGAPNDIPDESSDKFIDFLAARRERLKNSRNQDEVEIQIGSSNNNDPSPDNDKPVMKSLRVAVNDLERR